MYASLSRLTGTNNRPSIGGVMMAVPMLMVMVPEVTQELKKKKVPGGPPVLPIQGAQVQLYII